MNSKMRKKENQGFSFVPACCGMAMMMFTSSMMVGCSSKTDTGTPVDTVIVKEMIVGENGISSAFGNFGYSGTVEEENGVMLSFAQGGTIKQLCVKVGDRVHRGQLIATVDPTSVRNTYDMAHSTRSQVEDTYKRMKQLHEKGSLPDIKWVEVQSQLQQALSAENIAKKNLYDCNLYAPFDGVISEKNAEVGQNAAPGAPIVKLVTTNVLNVKISVPESEMAAIHVRQHADIVVQALDGKHYNGYVKEKGVIADPVSRSYSVKIRVEGADGALLPGMVSQVALTEVTPDYSESTGSSIVIPAHLVQLADNNTNFVWVDEGGKAVRRPIVCGEYLSNGVTVVSGLKRGDKLIIEGQQKVSTGSKLKTK